MNEKWELVAIVEGELQGELIRGLLEAHDIEVYLAQEGAAKVYGLNIGSMSEVNIYVRSRDLAAAKAVYQDYETGKLRNTLPNNFSEEEE